MSRLIIISFGLTLKAQGRSIQDVVEILKRRHDPWACLFLMIWGACFASVIIQSPLQNQVTHRPTIEFNATSSVNRGFFMINDELVPIRKQTKQLNLPLQMGQNDLVVYVLNDELKIQPNLTQKIHVYRQLNTDGDGGDEARVLTIFLVTTLYLVKNGDAKMDRPF